MNKTKENTQEENVINEIVIQTFYYLDDDGTIIYDFEIMAEEFENELSKLDDSIVVMCSVE